jgi:hypothetical protein
MIATLLRTREVRLANDRLLMLGYSAGCYRMALFYIVKPKGVPTIQRAAADHPELELALERIEQQAKTGHDARTIAAYLRSTSWGAELP